jgi:hypothetical protein
MGNFLSTKWGSFFKQFLAVMLMFTVTTEGGIANLGWIALLEASLLSMLPVILKLIQDEGGFFNTWYGGLTKSLIVIVIAYFLQVGDIFNIDWSLFVNSVWTAFVPVIINILNPGDERYGFASPKPKNLD